MNNYSELCNYIDTLSESSKNALEGAINELSSKKIEIGADIEDKAFI